MTTIPFLLAVVIMLLLGAGALSVLRRARFVAALGSAVLSAVALGLVLLGLAIGPSDVLSLPLGMAGPTLLKLDGLSGFFLLPVLLSSIAASVALLRQNAATTAVLPVLIAGFMISVLAASVPVMLIGFGLAAMAGWVLALTAVERADVRAAGPHGLGMVLFAVTCLAAAAGLLGRDSGDLSFEAVRAVAPTPGVGAAIALLTILGTGARFGLAPLHLWLMGSQTAGSAPLSALMSSSTTKVALYVLVRVLFDLCGPATPVWWGYPLLILGVASAVLGMLRALVENDVQSVLSGGTIGGNGVICVGLGVALVARGADLPGLAALALAGALLHALNHGIYQALLALAGGTVQHQAGTRRLDRLGGLVHRMPVATLCVLIGALAFACLPPFSGFAGLWLIFQAIYMVPRAGSLGLQIGFTVLVALLSLAMALAAAASLRLVGVAFLGRPRTPRAAAAEEASYTDRVELLGLAGLTLFLGLVPGMALKFALPAVVALTGVEASSMAGVFTLVAQPGLPGYAAPWVAGVIVLFVWVLLRVPHRTAPRRAPSWEGGISAPPPWLPFGDPAAQYGGLSMAQPMARFLGAALLGWRERSRTPPPVSPAAAQYEAELHGPVEFLLILPVLRVRFFLSDLANKAMVQPLRIGLLLLFATLVVLLSLVTWLEPR